MKKLILIILSASALFFSCKKEQPGNNNNNNTSSTKTYPVSFNVGFSQTADTINKGILKLESISAKSAAATDTLKNFVSELYYFVYDSNFHLVRTINQTPADTSFGKITDHLPAGTYTVIFTAGETGFSAGAPYYSIYNGTSTDTAYCAYSYLGQYLPPGADGTYVPSPFKANTFSKEFNITVGSTAVSYSVSLDRIVAQLEVVIKDRLPAGAQSIDIQVTGDAYAKNLINLSPVYYDSNYYYLYLNAAPGTANTKYFAIIGNVTRPFMVEIRCTDKNSLGSKFDPVTIYGDKTVTSVTCKANETTVLTGNLFTGGGNNSGFTITYDPTWDTGSPTTIHF